MATPLGSGAELSEEEVVFPASRGGRKDLEARFAEIEDVYPLSSMQQGMLYHTLETPDAGMYCVRVSYELLGPLDGAAFAAAWQRVVDRHPVLRSAIDWGEAASPMQVVHRRALVPVEHHDWRSRAPEEQEAALGKLVEEEGARGFDLSRPPLLRLALVRRGEERHELVLTHHHLLMDGSCRSILFDEVFALYDGLRGGRGRDLPQPRPYREFIEWMASQDLAPAERYWRAQLRGFTGPTRISPQPAPASSTSSDYVERSAELSPQAAEALQLFARRERVTLNTILLGLWALVLSRVSGTGDVVFGTTVNGRPVSLPGAESMIGLFINTLPVRVQVRHEDRLVPWLRKLQLSQARARDHAYSPLSQILRWSELAGGQRLFESNVVFENNLGYGSENERYGEIVIGKVRASMRNSFPLTLRCVPGPPWSLQMLYERPRLSDAFVSTTLGRIVDALSRLSKAREQALLDVVKELSDDGEAEDVSGAQAYQRAVREKLKRAAFSRQGTRTPSPRPAADPSRAFPEPTLPVLVPATASDSDLASWIARNREELTRTLRRSGALLFRGFGVDGPAPFERIIESASGPLLEYTYRSSPRTLVAGRIYTSTEYPADRRIPLHNENSYSRSWPMKLWFCCLVPARRGGETPLADSRRVLRRLSPGLRERFERRGVQYVRNYGHGVDLPWQEVFQTEDRSEVERHCREAAIELEWQGDDILRTRQVCPAVATHPETGDVVWFNQAHLFHVSSLEPVDRDLLLETFGEENLPRNAYYGDGSAIGAGELEEIRAAYEAETVVYPWEAGDVLAIDNMLVAHGRASYEGPRKVIVGMTEPHGTLAAGPPKI